MHAMEMFTAFVLFHTLRNSKQRYMILHKHAIIIKFKHQIWLDIMQHLQF